MITDPAGNIYVAGSTSSVDLPVLNAAQPHLGEAEVNYSLDGGHTWVKTGNPSQAPKTIQADPVSASVVYVGGSDGLFKSSDRGGTWSKIYSSALSIAIYPGNPAHIYVLTPDQTENNLVFSKDGGQTWSAPAGSIEFGSRVAVSAWAPETVAVVGSDLRISRDSGATWALSMPTAYFTTMAVAFDPQHAGWIYAAAAERTSGSMALSMDSGLIWTSKSAPNVSSSAIQYLLPDPDQQNVLYASLFAACLKLRTEPGPGACCPRRKCAIPKSKQRL